MALGTHLSMDCVLLHKQPPLHHGSGFGCRVSQVGSILMYLSGSLHSLGGGGVYPTCNAELRSIQEPLCDTMVSSLQYVVMIIHHCLVQCILCCAVTATVQRL